MTSELQKLNIIRVPLIPFIKHLQCSQLKHRCFCYSTLRQYGRHAAQLVNAIRRRASPSINDSFVHKFTWVYTLQSLAESRLRRICKPVNKFAAQVRLYTIRSPGLSSFSHTPRPLINSISPKFFLRLSSRR